MSLYEAYLKEREGMELYETKYGFATFKTNGKECYLRDIYVVPSHRRGGYASHLADAVCDTAKQRGCEWLIGSVAPNVASSNDSLMGLMAYGMTVFKTDEHLIYFKKRIT